jgi:hypothetical protein
VVSPCTPLVCTVHTRTLQKEIRLLTIYSAAGFTFLAFLTSLSTHLTVQLVASLLSFFSALLTLIAFAIDIALYAYVKHEVGKLDGVNASTNTAPGKFHLTHIETSNTQVLITIICSILVDLCRPSPDPGSRLHRLLRPPPRAHVRSYDPSVDLRHRHDRPYPPGSLQQDLPSGPLLDVAVCFNATECSTESRIV